MNPVSIILPVTYLDRSATLSITDQKLHLTLDEEQDSTTTYPLHVIYGIHPKKVSSSLTLDIYLSPASLKDSNNTTHSATADEGSNTLAVDPSSLGQTSLVFTIKSWTDETDTVITRLIDVLFPRRDAYHIYTFLNPTSGQQKATQTWRDTVLPMLQSAGFQAISPVTYTVADKVRQQAYELGQQVIQNHLQQQKKALILCLGGDGTLHDLINGLLDALDEAVTATAAAAAHGSEEEVVAVPTWASVFQLGVIPAGSGNAFASSLNLHTQDVGQAVLRIIHGQTRPFHLLDVGVGQVTPSDGNAGDDDHDKNDDWTNRVVMEEQREPRRIFVVASWGFHAQILSKSRYLRYIMGNKRFTLVAMALLFFLHHYKGDVVLKQTRRYDRDTKTFVDQKDNDGSVTLSSSDPTQAGGFTYFLITKQAALEPGFCITPFASPFDQEMDVMCMRQATADQLKTVAGLAFQGGKHVDHPAVDYYKTQDVYLRVHEATDICLDGEILPVRAMDVIRIQSIQDKVKKDAFVVFV